MRSDAQQQGAPGANGGAAAKALAQADAGWLADLITRQEPLGQWEAAYTRKPMTSKPS